MKGYIFWTVLFAYAFLLLATGYLAFEKFPKTATQASEEMIKKAGDDQDLRQDMLEDVKTARQRREDLIKLAAHSFDVILGALLGFLSAAAASIGLTGRGSDSESKTTTPPGVEPR